jgi:hypothetical protein|tara:strand:- start:699 stop:1280 length:582 start_codon:yes stop_codon:yes gene_type:complete
MANDTGNFGLRAARQLDGSPYNGAQNRYRILKNYATAIYQGDLVMTSLNGTIQRAGATDNPVVGVFNGVFYTDPTTSKPTWKNYYPASISANDIMAQVIDGPDVVFEVNADATFTVSHLFANYKINATTGDTTSGQGRESLDVATADSSSTFVLKAVDISQDPDNSDTTASSGVNVLVVLNAHSYKSGTVGQT